MPVKYCKSGYIVSMRKTNVLFALKELVKLLFPVLMQFPLLEWGGGGGLKFISKLFYLLLVI